MLFIKCVFTKLTRGLLLIALQPRTSEARVEPVDHGPSCEDQRPGTKCNLSLDHIRSNIADAKREWGDCLPVLDYI
jgi:hypothetical protein